MSIIKRILWRLGIWVVLPVLFLELFQYWIYNFAIAGLLDKLVYESMPVKISFIGVILILIFGLFSIKDKRNLLRISFALSIIFVYTLYRLDWIPHPDWSFVKIYPPFYYLDAIYLLVSAYGIGIITRRIQEYKWKESKHILASGGPIHNACDDEFGYKESALQLAKDILKSKDLYRDNALIIGLKSKWGTGKTSFLNLFSQSFSDKDPKLYRKAIVVKFNPWYSSSQDQMVADFFNTLYDGLKDYNFIGNEIRKYAGILSDSGLGFVSKISGLLLGHSGSSLEESFKELSRQIGELGKPLIIIIDDLDRLRGNEILNVIKLIRNTANFRNTVFVVAYDEDYVISMLEEHEKMEDAKYYLEKIFTVPYSLPPVSGQKKQLVIGETISKILLLNSAQHQKVVRFLDDMGYSISLRNAVRLANEVSFLISKLKDENNNLIIDLYDLLLLQMLQAESSHAYEALARVYDDIPDRYSSNHLFCPTGHVIKLNYYKSFSSDDKLTDEEFIEQRMKPNIRGENTMNYAGILGLLKLLFDKPYSTDIYEISNSSVYKLFFEMTSTKEIITEPEFKSLLACDKDKFAVKISEWMKIKNPYLLVRFLESVKFDAKEEYIELLSKSMCLLPQSRSKEYNDIENGTKIIVLAGSERLDTSFDDKENRSLYRLAVQEFLNDIDSVDIEMLNKKATLLQWKIKRRWDDIFIQSYDSDNQPNLLKKMCVRYINKYITLKNDFRDFRDDYWLMADYFDFDNRIEVREIFKSHIKENILSFIENYSTQKLKESSVRGLFYRYETLADGGVLLNRNDWMNPFKAFLNDLPDEVKQTELFSKYMESLPD